MSVIIIIISQARNPFRIVIVIQSAIITKNAQYVNFSRTTLSLSLSLSFFPNRY